MKKILSAVLCCCLCLLCACSEQEQNPPAESEHTEPGPEFKPLTDIQEGRKNIYLIVKSLESSYWAVVMEGAKTAGYDLDCNVYYSGTYSEMDWEYQAELMEDCIRNHADAILLSPDDSVMLAPEISEVHAAGIPVVLIDTIANTEDYDICYMTDNLIAGQNAAEAMLSLLQERGFQESDAVRIGIMVGSVTSQTINERLAGFFQFWTQNAPENWKIITDIVSYDGNTGLAEDLARDMLGKYPEINGVYGTNNGPTAGFAKTLRELNRTDISVVGFDYSDAIAELIASPDFSAATMLQRQFDMSYEGVKSALALIAGEESSIKFIDTGVVTVSSHTLRNPEVQEVIAHN